MNNRKLGNFLLVLIPGIFFVGYVLYPVGSGLLESIRVDGSFSLELYSGLFGESTSSTVQAVFNSVTASLLTVFLGAVLGTFLAVALTQTASPFRTLAGTIAVAPVAMPPLVGVIAFLFVFGEGGFFPRVLSDTFSIEASAIALDGFAAIVAVHVYSFHVYTLLFVSASLRELDSSVLEAASVLGSSPARTFFRVILPELTPALIASASLTFMSSMASFSAPLIFGGGLQFLTTLIYSTKLNGDLEIAGAQSGLLMMISVLFFIILSVATRRERGRGARKGGGRAGVLGMSRGAQRLLITLAVLVLMLEVIPMLMIVLVSFAKEGSWTWQLLPTEYTLTNYLMLIVDPAVFTPVKNSLLMGFLTVVAAAVTGTAAAALLTKGILKKFRFFLDPMLSLPFAIPGTVIAIFLIVTYSSPLLLTGGQVLLGTFWILPLAYFIRTYPFVLRSASAAFDQLDTSMLEAAEMFGKGPVSNFRKVMFPVLLPGILAGSLLVMIVAIGEFPSSILLYTHANRPISVEILSQMRGYNFGSAAAYSIALLGLVFLLSLGSSRLERGRGQLRRD